LASLLDDDTLLYRVALHVVPLHDRPLYVAPVAGSRWRRTGATGCQSNSLAVQWPYMTTKDASMATMETRRRSRRLELRTTPDERDLIERAVAATGTDLTEFVVVNAVDAARRVLADRDRFELDEDAVAEWDAINARRARDLPGLRRLVERPSPFAE